MQKNIIGNYVRYEDYARLKAEVQRLEEIVGSDAIDRKYGMCCDASDEVARLKAEVERLTVEADWKTPARRNKALEAEVERLTERNQFLEQIDSYLQEGINMANEERCIQLEAQVERLTKAGDAMAKEWVNCESLYHGNKDFIEAWNAAKKGGQP